MRLSQLQPRPDFVTLQDGRIEWEEFRVAVGGWVSSRRGTKRRASADPDAEVAARKRIHRDIGRYFSQFALKRDYESVRRVLQAEMAEQDALDDAEELAAAASDGAAATAEAKVCCTRHAAHCMLGRCSC